MGLLFNVLGAALGVSSNSSGSKTKSYYASKIADKQAELAGLKADLANMKGRPYVASGCISACRNRIAVVQGEIARLKAEMKSAPKG